ncbi:MAG: DNA polymerase III subunit delta [Alphaproteobacteria bacterium]|nr:DNA polymerase III subunit delta [Alphaproteobacteria bacterium]
MKVATNRAEAFAGRPDPAARAILVYGPDAGMVRERAERLARSVTDDISDPFRVAELSGAALKDKPARLADEAAAMSLTGGRRVVRVRDATDGLAELFGRFLEHPLGDALIVVEAAALEARSSLRKVFESADNAAALACYVESGAELKRFVVDALRELGRAATDDALEFLVSHLGSDRLVTRRELDKLILYVGADTRQVTLDHVMACIGDIAALAMDDMAFAAFDGNHENLIRALGRAGAEGISPVALLRAAQRHAQRLHLAAGLVAGGATPDIAMKSLRPPVFFRLLGQFRKQLQLWSPSQLAAQMERLVEAELRCKSTGLPADAVCGQALAEIALTARALARRSGARRA